MTQNIGNAISGHRRVYRNAHSTYRLNGQISDEPIPAILHIQCDMVAMANIQSQESSGLMLSSLMKALSGKRLPFTINLCGTKELPPLALHHRCIERVKKRFSIV